MQAEFGTETTSYFFEDISPGMTESLTMKVTTADIEAFARVSGDHNPVHLDEAFAASTMFKKPIAHGMLTASYISAVFGTRLPGPGAIYISQTLNFRAPVYVGDEVTATVRVADLIEARKRVLFECVCKVGDKTVLEGEAVLMVQARPVA